MSSSRPYDDVDDGEEAAAKGSRKAESSMDDARRCWGPFALRRRFLEEASEDEEGASSRVPLVGSPRCSSAAAEEATARTQVVATRALLRDEVDMVLSKDTDGRSMCRIPPKNEIMKACWGKLLCCAAEGGLVAVGVPSSDARRVAVRIGCGVALLPPPLARQAKKKRHRHRHVWRGRLACRRPVLIPT